MISKNDDVYNKLVEMIAAISEEEEIKKDMSLMDDLELQSIDIFNLLSDIESCFNIKISERYLKDIDTVEDMYSLVLKLQSK